MKKNKNNIMNIRLITTTILSGAATLLMSNVETQACTYNSADDGKTITAEDLSTCTQIQALNVTGSQGGVIFGGNVEASGNNDYGIFFFNSTGTFDGDVTVSNNNYGIDFFNSTGTFDGDVTVSNNNYGIDFFNSTGTFDGDVEAKNNGTGIFYYGSSGTFNRDVTASDNIGTGINFNNSEVTFGGKVEASNNLTGMVFFKSEITFNQAIKAVNNNNKGIVINSSDVAFNGDVEADSLEIVDQEDATKMSHITFGDDITLTAPIITSNPGQGNLTFKGGVTINKDIGDYFTNESDEKVKNRLNEVEFLANDHAKEVKLNGSIYAKDLILGKAKYSLSQDITLDANTIINNPIFDLENHTLTFNGKVSPSVEATGEVIINTTYNGTDAGHIGLISGSEINLGDSELVINITDAPDTELPAKGETRTVGLIVANDGGTMSLSGKYQINNLNNESNNKLVNWSFDPVTGILSQTRNEDSTIIIDIVDNPDHNQTIEDLPSDTREDLENIAANEGAAATREMLDRLTNTDAVAIASAPVTLATQDTTHVISSRANKLSQSLQLIGSTSTSGENNKISGVASGDDAISKYGVWFSPFYGEGKQGSKGKQPGYKSTYYGGILGVDSLINDRTSLGLAFSYMNTNIKHKGLNVGDKTKVNSYILSGYGTYEINDNWFSQAVLTLGHSKVDNREIRKEFRGNSLAKAKYNLLSWGSELLAGYNYQAKENVIVTPFFGLEYNRLGKIKYQEKGTRLQNLKVKSDAKDRLEGVIGARVSGTYTTNIGQKEITYVPEIHGNIRYNILNKKPKLYIGHELANENTLSPKTASRNRSVYNLGGSLTSKHNSRWEYLLGYDIRIADKYVSHLGTLKLRLNL